MSDPRDINDRQLQRLLDEVPDVEPSAALRRAVAEIPLRHPRAQAVPGIWPLRSLWQLMLSAALVTSLGVLAGFTTAQAPAEDEGWEQLRALAFASEEELALDEELAP